MFSNNQAQREHIYNIHDQIRHLEAKDNNVQEIILEKDEETGIATVCIRSAAKNALSGKMICELTEVFHELSEWPEGKGVLLYGANGFFCSGSDLTAAKQTANFEDGFKLAKVMQYNMALLQSLPMISLALVEGAALGGGSELSTAADLRLMTPSAKIGFIHVRNGISPGWGGGTRLVQLVGHSRALEIISRARTVDSSESLRIGLCNHVIDDCDENDHLAVRQKALEYLKEHTVGEPATIAAMKSMINGARTCLFEKSLANEAILVASTWGKGPHMKALNSKIKHL